MVTNSIRSISRLESNELLIYTSIIKIWKKTMTDLESLPNSLSNEKSLNSNGRSHPSLPLMQNFGGAIFLELVRCKRY